MRNTKLILAMLAGCTVLSGAAFAQDASQNATPTPASTAGSQTHSSDSSMSSGSSMGNSNSSMGNENGSMKSTHKKAHHKMKKSDGSSTEPAKSSTSGM